MGESARLSRNMNRYKALPEVTTCPRHSRAQSFLSLARLVASGMALLWGFQVVASGDAAATKAHPNIVFILADDLGHAELGCYGQEKIQTPNIDRLAREGMRFTQCYSGSHVCAPSRSALMTGL